MRIFLLFSVLLPFIEPCSATRPLREIVLKDLINNFAVSISSEELLQKIQKLSNDYEDKILKNLQRLSNALMQDLLVFLQEDALSLDGIRAKIVAGGYQDFKKTKHLADSFCFYNLSRWSFDKIQCELTNPPDASKPNFRHLSDTTLKIFRKAEFLFQEYAQACAKIFNVTDEIAEILRTGIRSWYDLKKSDILANELQGSVVPCRTGIRRFLVNRSVFGHGSAHNAIQPKRNEKFYRFRDNRL